MEEEFGKSFIKNYNKRIRQHLSQSPIRSQNSSAPRHHHSPSPSHAQPQSDYQNPKYDYLYSKNNRANILNVVSQISDDVTPNPAIPISPEKIPLENAEYLGRGATMEVFAIDYCTSENKSPETGRLTSQMVAVKRVSREHAPIRNHALALEEDFVFLKGRDAFYAKVGAMTQEIKILAREPLYGHRNIVRLKALAWDEMPDIGLFAPIMIVELAWPKAPTLEEFFNPQKNQVGIDDEIKLDYYSLIADIADGLSVLHHCEVLHSDLKPSNILLFPETEEKDGQNCHSLVAKIGDFGFADVDRVLSQSDAGIVGIGQTREWAAPELLQDCPLAIRRLSTTVPIARDIYSFGLLMAYIVLGGRRPRELLQQSSNDDEDLDRLKIHDLLGERIEELIKFQWQNDPEQKDEKSQIVLDLIMDIVKIDPTARPASLSSVRLKIMGFDPYATQKHHDRFRIVPFTNIFSSEMAYSNLFQITTGISKRMLNSLPAALITEIRGLVGEEAAIYEPTVHSLRRIALQHQFGQKAVETKDGGLKSLLDEDGGKWSLDTLRTTLSWIPDIYELVSFMASYSFSVPHAEYDFLRTEYQDRPLIFTLIDGNNVRGVRKLLKEDPAQANTKLPDDSGGWSPIHLAACLGRTKIMKLILHNHSNIDLNVRSTVSQATPLHQAVIGRNPEVTEMLLRAGAHVDARYFIPNTPYARLRDLTPLEIAVEQCVTHREVTRADEKIIEMLLRAGADYLHNSGGRGYSVVFKALVDIKMLRIFVETIPPEDAKHLASIVDSDRQTLLFHAVSHADVPMVKYLLDKGADPRVRCVSGQNAYTRLRSAHNMGARGPGLMIRTPMMAILKKVPTPEEIEQTLQLIEESAGPDGTAADDYSFSAQEVEEMQTNFKSYEPITNQYLNSDKLQERMNLLLGLMDDSSLPTAFWVFSVDNVTVIETLKKNLEKWYVRRKQGLTAKDVLPDGWANFFTEPDRNSPSGFWNALIKESDIPAIAEFVQMSAISLAERFMDNNGSLILEKLVPVVEEMTNTGAFNAITDCFAIIYRRVLSIYIQNFQFTFIDKIVIYQRVKRIWRALAQGEVLDRLHDAAVALGIDGSIDEFARGMIVEDIDVDLPTPPDAIETLRLARRYPGTTIFITSKTTDLPYKRIALAIHQLAVLLLPAFVLAYTLYLEFLCLRASSLWAFVLARIWYNFLLPRDWILIDHNLHLHPNILRGLFAAFELIWFRISCPWINIKVGEPLILSLRPGAKQVDIPMRLQHMRKETQWPVYRLSLRRHAECEEPIPCYAAMGDTYRKWRNGGLPRKAWCDGWWEKKKNEEWERVNANGKPTWTEYTNATKEIKTILLGKGREDVYYQFLRVRDYWLNTPGQQLQLLQTVFGKQHVECLQIWQKLFLRDSSSRAWVGRSDSPMPWWNRFAYKMFLDGVWSSWDAGLLDTVGY